MFTAALYCYRLKRYEKGPNFHQSHRCFAIHVQSIENSNFKMMKIFNEKGKINHLHSGGGGMECCPLVVDYLTFISLLTFIGLATYFFNEFIAMSMLAKKKKRRRRNVNIHSIVFAEGNF